VNAGGGSDCLVSYHDICKNDDGLCKQEWVSGCDYCEVDNIEYSCELPSGGGSASCGIAEKCIITLPPPPSDCVDVGSESFVGCYLDLYSDPSLPLKRTDPIINFDWGEDSPDESLYSDYFSVKWEGDFTFPTTGFYTFYIATDDGVRIYVDGELVFDRWYDQSAVLVEEQVFVYSGVRRIKVEYYEKGGDAEAHFGWELEQAINEPNRPSISGDLTTLINSNYLFQIHSTDPQGYNIRYGLDWSNPLDDIVDDWIPSTGYLSSGTYQDASHVFPVAGEVSFAVLAQNEWGLNSDWRYKDILVYHPEPILEATPSSVDLGDVVSVSFSEVAEPTSLDWIGMYLTNEYDNSQYIDWLYTSTCSKTGGVARASGVCNFTVPGIPDNYNFRIFENDGFRRLTTSNSVNVSDLDGVEFSVTVSVAQSPGGSIQSTDTIIDTRVCGSPCVRSYPQDSAVTLQALPSSSYWMFNGWSGACTGVGDCIVSVDSDVVVTASFVPRLFFYTEQ
jgi:hypothetical protein